MAAGDTRCGRQLLLEADADAARGLSAALNGGGDVGGGGGQEPLRGLIQAARAVEHHLRRIATICAAASCSAVPEYGQDQVDMEAGCCDPTSGMAAVAGAHPPTAAVPLAPCRAVCSIRESNARRISRATRVLGSFAPVVGGLTAQIFHEVRSSHRTSLVGDGIIGQREALQPHARTRAWTCAHMSMRERASTHVHQGAALYRPRSARAMGLMYSTVVSGTASQATPRGRHRKRAGRARTDDQTI